MTKINEREPLFSTIVLAALFKILHLLLTECAVVPPRAKEWSGPSTEWGQLPGHSNSRVLTRDLLSSLGKLAERVRIASLVE